MFPYGAVYKVYREHTLEDIQRNLQQIKNLGMNFVVIWPSVFWWEDPSLPDYPYHTGHEILRFAERIGLKIIMETAGQIACLEYAPDFAMKDEYYVVTKDGQLSRDHNHFYFGYINYFHPEVRQMMERYLRGIAENYKGYSSLYGYDIWNETMFESHDQYTYRVFQNWLKDKYGTLDALNDAWECTYSRWEQVRYSQLLWASVTPYVDYKQFHKDSIGILLNQWKNAVKSADDAHPVIADNIHSMITNDGNYYERAQDDWVVAGAVDEMGISFYPKGGLSAMHPATRALTFAAINSANGGEGFWVSELQSHHQAMFNPFSYVYPHELKWWNFEAISRGAKGVVYWKWNCFQKGLQTGGRGLVDSAGRETPRADQARQIAALLARHGEIGSSKPIMPRVAILYDRLCHDFTKAYTLAYAPRIPNTIYTDGIEGLYQCLWNKNIPADIVTPKDVLNGDLAKYKSLFITGQLNASPELTAALRGFIADGGVVICDGKFSEINDDGILQPQIPGGWTGLLGYHTEDMEPVNLAIRMNMDGHELSLDGYYERKLIQLDNGNSQVLGSYSDGRPAVLRTKHGKGEFLYFSSLIWYGYFSNHGSDAEKLMELLQNRYELTPSSVDCDDVKVAWKQQGDKLVLFAFNYGDCDADCAVSLKDAGDDGYRCVDLTTEAEQRTERVYGTVLLHLHIAARDTGIYSLLKI